MSRTRVASVWTALVLAAVCNCALAAPAVAQAADDETAEDLDEIVVTGRLSRGSVVSEVRPEARIERTTIRALGADSLSDVIDAFAPQARALNRQGEPILLLEGRRITDRREIDDLPPEAIRTIEIFPEQLSLQYGFAPDQRVINVILRRKYRAITIAAKSDIAIGDGGSTYRATANALHITPEGRVSLDAEVRYRDPVSDGHAPDEIGTRNQLPRDERYKIKGLWAHWFDGMLVNANLGLQREDKYWRLGKDDSGASLRRNSREDKGSLALSLSGSSGAWQWFAKGSAEVGRHRVSTRMQDGGRDAAPWRNLVDSTYSTSFEANANGPVLDIAPGTLTASLSVGANREHSHAYDPLEGATRFSVNRSLAWLFGSFDLPIVRDKGLGLFADARGEAYRQGPTLGRYDVGLRSSPLAGLDLTATLGHASTLPEFDSVAAGPLDTPNVRSYDFGTGQQVYLDLLTGGNRGLVTQQASTLDLRLAYRPWASRDLTLSVDYSKARRRHLASEPLGPTPTVEAVFPDRFERDSSGRLVAFDARPVSILRAETRQLRTGLNVGLPTHAATSAANANAAAPGLPPAKGKPVPGQIQIALYHTWTLKDDVRLTDGGAWVDLLDGNAISPLGGTSRHRIEAQLGYASKVFGLRAALDWKSPTHVGGDNTRLHFAPGVTMDMHVFVNLKVIGDALEQGWIKGRLNLSVDNVLGARTKITDAQGNRVHLYRDATDTSGRTIRLTFRKIFR